MSWNLLPRGDHAHPLCAGRRRPQLLLDLLPDLLHCDLGLFDGSLGCVKPAEGVEHKVIIHIILTTHQTTRTTQR